MSSNQLQSGDTMSQIEFIQISVTKTQPLRIAVLRPHCSNSTVDFEFDNHALSLHLSAQTEGKIIGISSLLPQDQSGLFQKKIWRFRGMAVDPKHQKQGIGVVLVEKSIEYAHQQNAELIWCNARSHATGFYQKTGFQIKGSEFEIKDIGPHFYMELCLK